MQKTDSIRKHQEPFRVGLIGTGKISDIYLQNCAKWSGLSIDVCGSLNLLESEEKAAKYGIPCVAQPDDIIADPNLDCILNLTIPAVHADVSTRALKAGKHVYSENLSRPTVAMALQSLVWRKKLVC